MLNRLRSYFSTHVPTTAGMGVVEVILITIVLIGLVVIFQGTIRNVVQSILSTLQSNVGQIK